MDTTLIKRLLQCNFNENELKPIHLELEDLAEGIVECELSVYAKILTLKESFIQGEDPLGLQFDECTFWIYVRGLNSEYFTWDVASKLANSFPGCEGIELRWEKGGAKFFRLKAVINVLVPLRRLIRFQLDEEVITGYLAYERLPYLCFKCGLLGNLVRQCPELGEGADPKKSVPMVIDEGCKVAFPYTDWVNQVGIKEALQFFEYQSPKSTPENSLKGKMGTISGSKKRHHPYSKSGGTLTLHKKLSFSSDGLEVSTASSEMAKADEQPRRSQ
ncbi:hypothetical protein LIER_08522 [Lithospermum erythrorhizon]|uniref:CCHC-type domain-containing protein n=1 Tax=Lithospermum erythrorhizon TaxID=34254 RepID=A0AAV3PCD8_LITER